MPKTTRVIATFCARPGSEEALREILEALVEPTRRENGCRLYELWRSRENEGEFTFVEEWDSDEALKAHSASDHIARARASYPEHLAADPKLRLYELVS